MTTDARITRRKLSLLEFAMELGNVCKARRIVGYSRQEFYEIWRNCQTFGAEGLVDRVRGLRGLTRTAWRARSSSGVDSVPPSIDQTLDD